MTDSSLHTKYRPKTFKQVIGQDEVVDSLKRVIKNDRAHAFIFHGPAGTGKTTLARILAEAFAGEGASQANIEEIPAALFTGVGDVRLIADKARHRAIGASHVKAIILDEAHRLSAQAWDGLLKLIEEPPAHVYFMFCTTNPGKIPKTIQTRCLSFQLSELDEDDLLKLLKRVVKKEKIEIDKEVLETISESSDGSPRQALVFLEACQYCESAAEARKLMKKVGEGSKEVIDLARLLINKRECNWTRINKILTDLKGQEAESIRIVISNYVASVILNTKSEKEVARLMFILDAFATPYNQSDKFAPLLLSIGMVLGMGE